MGIGIFNCKFDAKGRVLLPASLRKRKGEAEREDYVLMLGAKVPAVELYTREQFDALSQAFCSRVYAHTEQGKRLRRAFFSRTHEVQLDGSSRLLLPKRFIDYMHSEGELVMLGMEDRVEIWDASTYAESQMTDDEFGEFFEQVWRLPEEK